LHSLPMQITIVVVMHSLIPLDFKAFNINSTCIVTILILRCAASIFYFSLRTTRLTELTHFAHIHTVHGRQQTNHSCLYCSSTLGRQQRHCGATSDGICPTPECCTAHPIAKSSPPSPIVLITTIISINIDTSTILQNGLLSQLR